MKKLLLFIVVSVAMIACSVPIESIANIEEAAGNENCAYVCAKQYALQAKNEGLPRVELVLKAFAKAQLFHKDMLIELIEKKPNKYVESLEQCPCQGDSTIVNLYRLLANTQYDFYNLYPEFIDKAKSDEFERAVKGLEQIMEVNISEIAIFESIIDFLSNHKSDDMLPEAWNVCHKCGKVIEGKIVVGQKCKLCSHNEFSQFSL